MKIMWSDRALGLNAGDLVHANACYLSALLFFAIVVLRMEVSACLCRRQRDVTLATIDGSICPKIKRKVTAVFKGRCAQESQRMRYRSYVLSFATLAIWLVLANSLDRGGTCFFILGLPSPFRHECALDVMFPAAIFAGVMLCGILAAVWAIVRPRASLVLFATCATGVVAIQTASLSACAVWLLCALGFNHLFFAILPFLRDPPRWCEDLGSLAFATDPSSGAIRDGSKAQHWDSNGSLRPSPSELGQLRRLEQVCFHVADFYQTRLRWLRVLWNGVMMRAMVLFLMGRRCRVFGAEHIAHLGSHDKVLVAGNHRTFFDFWIITVCGLWQASGAPLFSFYPVRATWFYTHTLGLVMNMLFSAVAMFPPILNTPSDKRSHELHTTDLRQRSHTWNDFAIRRVIADLKTPGVLCGLANPKPQTPTPPPQTPNPKPQTPNPKPQQSQKP